MGKGKTINELKIGDSASWVKEITQENVETFGNITEDKNPVHFSDTYASNTMFKKRISHGMYVGSLFSKLLGLELPGEGSIYTNQTLKFLRPVYFGDTITATVTIKEIILEKNRVIFDCVAINQDGKEVVLGEATIMPPK